jgi:hypothetical protein
MLQDEIVVILCELEIYFPTFLHNMMSFERQNCVMKGYVRNRARPDASMAKDTFATRLFGPSRGTRKKPDTKPGPTRTVSGPTRHEAHNGLGFF